MTSRILVVEDDPTLNQRLCDVIGEHWMVEGVLTAAAARRRLEREHFDLVLLDLHLPDADGLDLLAELERDGLVSRAVILTGHGDLPAAVEAMRLHTLDFLTKPVTPDELVDRVHRALGEEPPVASNLDEILSRARRFLRVEKIDEAAAELDAARRHHPGNPEVVNLQGVVAELRHDLTAAADLYRLAADLGRPYPAAQRNAERVVFRSWKGSGAGRDIDFGDRRRRTTRS